MNRRIVKNGLLALGLSAVAMWLPVQESAAQSCTTQACEQCVAYWGLQLNNCIWGCAVIGAPGCPDICQSVYAANVATCYNM